MRESRLKTYAFLAVSGLLAVALVPGARAQEWSGSAEGSTTDGPTKRCPGWSASRTNTGHARAVSASR